MASLRVRNVDDAIVARLKEQAKLQGRSAEAEHLEILKRALEWDSPSPVNQDDWEKRAKAFRDSLKGRYHTPSEILIREDRDRR